MSKLTDGQVEQIISMRKEGKTHQEVEDFFSETYDITLYRAEIVGLCKGKVPKKYGTGRPKKYKKRQHAGEAKLSLAECKYKLICKFADNCQSAICKFI